MGFFNKYPYTDFHELNLDYLLNVVKKIDEKLEETSNRIPKAPTDAGDYVLHCVVDADGNQSYEWRV